MTTSHEHFEGFTLAYADDPARWVYFTYDWSQPPRELWDR